MGRPTTPWEATLTGEHGDIILSNTYELDDARFILNDIRGWFGGVGVTGDQEQRALNHGLFEGPARRGGRVITLTGSFLFARDYDRHTAARYLSSLMWDGEYGKLTVTSGDLELTSFVRLDGEIDATLRGDNVIKLSVPLIAADPFLYAQARLYQIFPAGFGEGLVFPLFATKKNPEGTPVLDWGEGTPYTGAFGNVGNATAYPVFTVYGDWPAGFTITESGRSISFGAAVDESSPVVIDTRAGSVHVGGIDHTYQLTSREWIDCPAGMSIQPRIYAHAPSSGWCDVQISDTYI